MISKRGAWRSYRKTFSTCSDVDRFDERKWIDLVVGKTGCACTLCLSGAGTGFLKSSPSITWHQDEPFWVYEYLRTMECVQIGRSEWGKGHAGWTRG